MYTATENFEALVTKAAVELSQQPEQTRESRAEILRNQAVRQVTATKQGQELWEAKRLEELAASRREDSVILRAACNAGAAQRLDSLIASTARERGVTRQEALHMVLATAEGRELWEAKRAQELADSKEKAASQERHPGR